MRILLISIQPKTSDDLKPALEEFLKRTSRYSLVEALSLKNTQEFSDRVAKERAAGAASVVLLDSRGKLLTSEEFATEVGRMRDGGKRTLLLAIGPPDGWSAEMLKQADWTLSLGRMTLPHQLARLVLAEQVYRAFTILAGHPYHGGH